MGNAPCIIHVSYKLHPSPQFSSWFHPTFPRHKDGGCLEWSKETWQQHIRKITCPSSNLPEKNIPSFAQNSTSSWIVPPDSTVDIRLSQQATHCLHFWGSQYVNHHYTHPSRVDSRINLSYTTNRWEKLLVYRGHNLLSAVRKKLKHHREKRSIPGECSIIAQGLHILHSDGELIHFPAENR